jgi:hypothetical protein
MESGASVDGPQLFQNILQNAVSEYLRQHNREAVQAGRERLC